MAKVELYHYKVLQIAVLLLLLMPATAISQYFLRIEPVDRDTVFVKDSLRLQQTFKNRDACAEYIQDLTGLLLKRGFANASLDSVRIDSAFAVVQLYLGDKMNWTRIH